MVVHGHGGTGGGIGVAACACVRMLLAGAVIGGWVGGGLEARIWFRVAARWLRLASQARMCIAVAPVGWLRLIVLSWGGAHLLAGHGVRWAC